jgi:hypothetical protein
LRRKQPIAIRDWTWSATEIVVHIIKAGIMDGRQSRAFDPRSGKTAGRPAGLRAHQIPKHAKATVVQIAQAATTSRQPMANALG